MAQVFDAHTHLQFLPFDKDRDAVIARAQAGKVKIILVGTQNTTSKAGVALAERYPDDMWAAVGFHPSHASGIGWYHDKNEQLDPHREIFDIELIKDMARHPQVVAIGECGFDYFRLPGDPDQIPEIQAAQRSVFSAQTQLSLEIKKPLMIHCRSGKGHNAFHDTAEIVRSAGSELPPSVIHFFTGTLDDAKLLLDLGCSFTFGGVITFSHDYDEVIKAIPIENILSETDAPYLAPAEYRGQRNEPAYVIKTVAKLAELKGVSTEEMTRHIWQNAQRIFSIT